MLVGDPASVGAAQRPDLARRRLVLALQQDGAARLRHDVAVLGRRVLGTVHFTRTRASPGQKMWGGHAWHPSAPRGDVPAHAPPPKKMWGGHAWRARGARAYNGSGAEPLVRSQGLGAKPSEADNLLAFGAQRMQQIYCILRILQIP